MDRIEEFTFLERLMHARVLSTQNIVLLLTRAFPALSEQDAKELLLEFNIYNKSAIENQSAETSDWQVAWDNIEYNKFISASPRFENFDKERIMSEFNVTSEKATEIMLEFAQNYPANYAVMVLDCALPQPAQENSEM